MARDFSIVAIIALYQGAEFIEEAVRSVLNQSLKPDEFIVVDDGSTDEGPAIVERLASEHPEIRLLQKPNGGQSSARNFGVAQSRSALIALLDQDDAWYRNHLEELVKPFCDNALADPPLGWAYSDLDEVDEAGLLVRRGMLKEVSPSRHPKRSLFECLKADMFILPSASLIARSAFETIGGFDESLSGYEDDDLFLRLFRAGYQNIYLDRPLSKWRIYTRSTSFTPRMAKSRMNYARKLMATYADDPARNHYFLRDLIGPRFMAVTLNQYVGAIASGNQAAREQAERDYRDLLAIAPGVTTRQNRLLLRLMRYPHAFKAVLGTRLFLSRLTGRPAGRQA